MSSIDLTNAQVLRNYLISRMKEGKGKFVYREKVLVFKDKTGTEMIAPEEVLEHLEKKEQKAIKPEKSEGKKTTEKKASSKVVKSK